MSTSTGRGLIPVVEYDLEWPDHFRQLRDRIWPTVRDIAVVMEHVGSTAVAGLAAKPIIDLDIVIPSQRDLASILAPLESLGYEHRGNLGIEDREAFRSPQSHPAHHLYVCSQGSIALRNHVTLRDHLRSNPSDAATYSSLKKRLAQQYAGDMDGYVEGKTHFILSILAQYDFSADRLESIRQVNQSHR